MKSREEIIKIFEEAEIELIKEGSLRLYDIDKNTYLETDITDLKEFTKCLLRWVKSSIYSTKDEREFIQCYPNKDRSLGDLYRITISYLPETKLLDLLEVLYQYNTEKYIYTYKCPDINKRVWLVSVLWEVQSVYNLTNNIKWWNKNLLGEQPKEDEFDLLPEDYVTLFTSIVVKE